MPEITYNISLNEFKTALNNLPADSIIILRFTAEWCEPCQKINNDCNSFFSTCNEKIIPFVIDVEQSLDLYGTLKKYKMINGIPALLAYYGNDKQHHWFVPNYSIVGGNKEKLNEFFLQCNNHIKKIL